MSLGKKDLRGRDFEKIRGVRAVRTEFPEFVWTEAYSYQPPYSYQPLYSYQPEKQNLVSHSPFPPPAAAAHREHFSLSDCSLLRGRRWVVVVCRAASNTPVIEMVETFLFSLFFVVDWGYVMFPI